MYAYYCSCSWLHAYSIILVSEMLKRKKNVRAFKVAGLLCAVISLTVVYKCAMPAWASDSLSFRFQAEVLDLQGTYTKTAS